MTPPPLQRQLRTLMRAIENASVNSPRLQSHDLATRCHNRHTLFEENHRKRRRMKQTHENARRHLTAGVSKVVCNVFDYASREMN
jgi:hypothetical protein